MSDKSMTPSKALKEVAVQNDHFVREHKPAYFEPHQRAQTPFLTLVSCCDSRVQPTVLLRDPVNQAFVIENIGNQFTNSRGSVDYGVLHLQTPILMILGHADCGAIKAHAGGYENETSGIKEELDSLNPPLANFSVPEGVDHDHDILGRVQTNVDYQVAQAVKHYQAQVDAGTLVVVGAFYDFWNACEKGQGRVVVLNVNGETDSKKLQELPLLGELDEELCGTLTTRLS